LLLVGTTPMTRHLLNRSLAALLLTALTGGCDDLDNLRNFDCHGTIQHETTIECESFGEVQLTSATFPLPANIAGLGPCPDASVSCIAFTAGEPSHLFQMTLTLGPIDEGTYALRRSAVGDLPAVSGKITASDYTAPLVV